VDPLETKELHKDNHNLERRRNQRCVLNHRANTHFLPFSPFFSLRNFEVSIGNNQLTTPFSLTSQVIEISSGSEPSSSSSSYSSYYSSESEYSEENSSEASEVALSSAATDATGVVTISSQSSNPSSVSGKEDSCESEEEERKRKDEGDDGDEEEETRVGNNAETFGERRDVPATTSDKGDAKDAKEVFLSPEQKIKESKEFHEADQEEWRRRNEVIRQQSLKAKIERKRKKESNLRVEKRLKEFKTQRAEEKQAISDADVLRPQVRTMINHVTRGSMHFPTVMQRLGLHNFPQAGAFGIGGCSKAEITKIYRKTILKYHPDRNQNLPLREKIRNEEIFKVVQTAYEAYK